MALFNFRGRRERRNEDDKPVISDAAAAMMRWADAELAPWAQTELTSSEVEEALLDHARTTYSICPFRIDGLAVEIEPGFLSDHPEYGDHTHPMGIRALAYRTLLRDSLYTFGGGGAAVVAIHLDDLFAYRPMLPLFCFQKPRGSRALLLPDVDFINSNYYADPDRQFIDKLQFSEKSVSAIFVGSTTGDLPLTSEHVRNQTNERIRSAIFFRDKPDVIFELPNIVQVDSPDTLALIESLGVAGRYRSWQEQLDHAFLLSLDGNGATCSRVALSLASNSTLMKYESKHQLHYFGELKPWRDYVPVADGEDVMNAIGDNKARRSFANIAELSTLFYRTYLTRLSLFWYTSSLLNQYIKIFGSDCGEVVSSRKSLFSLDSYAHIQNVGTVWGDTHGWTGHLQSSNNIEGFALLAPPEIRSEDLAYRARFADGSNTATNCDRQFCGSHGQGRPLHGMSVTLQGEARDKFLLNGRVAFADGRVVDLAADGDMVHSESPLRAFQLRIARRI